MQIPLEPFEQGGLADASLPAEHDQAPVAPPGLGRTACQQGQRRLPLKQFHASSVGHPRSMCHFGRPSRCRRGQVFRWSCYVARAMSEAWPDERNREAILRAAASLATEDGPNGLSAGTLAAALGRSEIG